MEAPCLGGGTQAKGHHCPHSPREVTLGVAEGQVPTAHCSPGVPDLLSYLLDHVPVSSLSFLDDILFVCLACVSVRAEPSPRVCLPFFSSPPTCIFTMSSFSSGGRHSPGLSHRGSQKTNPPLACLSRHLVNTRTNQAPEQSGKREAALGVLVLGTLFLLSLLELGPHHLSAPDSNLRLLELERPPSPPSPGC